MVAKESNLRLVIAGLMLGILMAAMDNTIVATSIGTIVSDLGGLDKFVWVTSAYMVAVMAGMPIFGKLSDMYGRKRFYIFGLLIFLIGSALCGTAQSIVQLSIYRAIQGIGGGALMPIAFTIVFDIFPIEKRGKMTGLLGAVFGSSSVLGPLLGAYITENISWHWIFYVNIPIGLMSLIFILKAYKENNPPTKQNIDWWGAITLVIAVISLMFALELGGKEFKWDSIQIIGVFASFIVFFVGFLLVERKVKDPIISFWMFKRKEFAISQIITFFYGATFVILTVFIPIFVQAVYGGSATNAGLILTPMMLGSVVGSAIGGIFQTKISYRNLMLLSVISFGIGMYLLGTMDPQTSRVLLTIYMIITGFGVGFSFSLLPTVSIHNMEPRFRGSATSTNSFFRSLGMTIGVTIFGSIQNSAFTANLKDAFKGIEHGSSMLNNLGDPSTIFRSDVRSSIPTFILEKIIAAMSSSITTVFLLALIPITVSFIAILFMGNVKAGTKNNDKVNVKS